MDSCRPISRTEKLKRTFLYYRSSEKAICIAVAQLNCMTVAQKAEFLLPFFG